MQKFHRVDDAQHSLGSYWSTEQSILPPPGLIGCLCPCMLIVHNAHSLNQSVPLFCCLAFLCPPIGIFKLRQITRETHGIEVREIEPKIFPPLQQCHFFRVMPWQTWPVPAAAALAQAAKRNLRSKGELGYCNCVLRVIIKPKVNATSACDIWSSWIQVGQKEYQTFIQNTWILNKLPINAPPAKNPWIKHKINQSTLGLTLDNHNFSLQKFTSKYTWPILNFTRFHDFQTYLK